MQKSMRVYELARELGVKSKDILEVLRDQMDIEVKNHMSSVNDQVAARVRAIVRGEVSPQVEEEKQPEAGESESEEAPWVEDAQQPTREKVARKPSREESLTAQPTGKRSRRQEVQPPAREIEITGEITVRDLAQKAGIAPNDAVRKLVSVGIMASVNQKISVEQAVELAESLGHSVTVSIPEAEDPLLALIQESSGKRQKPRAPVVTVLGHVDHGKTTLLDHIRDTRVTDKEAGGITQHIGASRVRVNDQFIVFLDTPGHEAFTAMRARGAGVTDIAVLVVAADDGVKPQTVEACNHAQEAGVPIVVALNKMDLPGANPDRVKQQLSELGLIPEEWGGDTVTVPVSAITGEGVDELLEMLLLVAELQDLKADAGKRGHGTVIDAELDRARGPVATVLVQEGTLKRGDPIVAGIYAGRVRAMIDDAGKQVKQAGPSMPVAVLGLDGVPEAGDLFVVVEDDRTARNIAQNLQAERRTEEIGITRPVTLHDLYEQLKEDQQQELRLILKADVYGSLEAMRESLEKLQADEVSVRVIHGGVGAVTESDVMLASASGAVIIGYNVVPDTNARRTIEREAVDVRTYRVIYEIIDDVRAALVGLLKPEIREEVLGRAEVRATFRVPGAGVVAGCYVRDGVIRRNAKVRVLRDGTILYEGDIASLRRFKDDVREVAAGYECGLGVDNWQDIQEGDELEVFVEREVKRDSAVS